MVLPPQVQVDKRMHQLQGARDQIIPFYLFFKKLEKVRPHQGCQPIESTVHGRMNPKLARFCAKLIDVSIIVFQSFHKFLISRIPILSFIPLCSQNTIPTNFFPLYLIGALITHKN